MNKSNGMHIVVVDTEANSAVKIEKATSTLTKMFLGIEEFKKQYDKSLKPMAIFVSISQIVKQSRQSLMEFRKIYFDIPLIALIEEHDNNGMSFAFEIGFNDCILKPLREPEIHLRLQTRLLDYIDKAPRSIMSAHDVTLDFLHNSISCKKNIANASKKDLEIIALFSGSEGKTISREILRNRIWGHTNVSNNAIDRKIFEVRKILNEIGSDITIRSQYGRGYFLLKTSTHQCSLLKSNQFNNNEIINSI